jgi:hypothetical protein
MGRCPLNNTNRNVADTSGGDQLPSGRSVVVWAGRSTLLGEVTTSANYYPLPRCPCRRREPAQTRAPEQVARALLGPAHHVGARRREPHGSRTSYGSTTKRTRKSPTEVPPAAAFWVAPPSAICQLPASARSSWSSRKLKHVLRRHPLLLRGSGALLLPVADRRPTRWISYVVHKVVRDRA